MSRCKRKCYFCKGIDNQAGEMRKLVSPIITFRNLKAKCNTKIHRPRIPFQVIGIIIEYLIIFK